MNVAILRVRVSENGHHLQYALTYGGQQEKDFTAELPSYDSSQELANPHYVLRVIAPEMRVLLKQWMLDTREPGVIAIHSDNALAQIFQWELLPKYLELPDALVVRMQTTHKSFSSWSVEPKMLVAGWPSAGLQFIDRELVSLASIGAESTMQIDVLTSPPLTELVARMGTSHPTILHLIPQAIYMKDGEPYFANGPDDSVSVRGLANAILAEHAPNLIVINSCDSGSTRDGQSAASVFNKVLGCVSVGWSGGVEDALAADFATFLYRRLSEGATPIHAIQKFVALDSMVNQTSIATRGIVSSFPASRFITPVSWCSTTEALGLTFQPTRQKGKESAARRKTSERTVHSGRDEIEPGIAKQESPGVSVELELRNALNPALLINGTTPITRLALVASAPVSNLTLEVSCDTGIGHSTVKQSLDLLAGPQPVPVKRFQFPALYELAEGSSRRRLINFTVTCAINGRIVSQDTASVLWMGLREWLDRSDVWPYVPAFVLPNSNGILDVIDKADEILKIDSPENAFDGYQSGQTVQVAKQMEAIFNTLRKAPLSYINPPASPIYEPGLSMSSGQLVRFPDEVIARKRGTCHDLALFFAGCAEHVGIYPLVILMAGHTYFGFWNDHAEHEDYWDNILEERKEQGRPANLFGGEWSITQKEELLELVTSDRVTLVEAVDVTNHNSTYSVAVKHGRENLLGCKEYEFDIAVDVCCSRRKIQPVCDSASDT